MSRIADWASAILLILALLGCATERPPPPPPEVEAVESNECTRGCQANHSTCSVGCGELARVSEIFEWGRPRTCLEDCKLMLEHCYATCE